MTPDGARNTNSIGRPTKWRSRLLAFASVHVILSLALWTTAAAASSNGFKPAPQPEWCKPGYRCLTIDDYARMTTIKIDLQEEVKKLRASSRHFGFGCAIGPSLGVTVDENLDAHLVPSVGATCGLAVKF